jgi:putative tryptophan/tyrosine transport system substrate-binding protein
MRRREFIAGIGGAAAWPVVARAEPPKLPTVGLLSGVSFDGPFAAPVVAIRQGLQEAGFVEGQNLAVEYRSADGAYERLSNLAADLAHRRVAVIIAIGAPRVALAAAAADSTVPIVLATGSDAVEVGVVDSFNRPEANAGGSAATAGPAVRRLELLLDLRPGATSLVGYLDNSRASQAFDANVGNLTEAARSKGRELAIFDAGTEREVETAFIGMALRRIRALVVAADAFLITRQEQIVELAAEQRLPTIYATRGAVLRGGLMSYGALTRDMYRAAGVYAGRILDSATSAALPVMPPARFEFVINKTTANALRITVPKQLLVRADEIVG